jgi:hypothetical protein
MNRTQIGRITRGFDSKINPPTVSYKRMSEFRVCDTNEFAFVHIKSWANYV